jgi:hypothetical protein
LFGLPEAAEIFSATKVAKKYFRNSEHEFLNADHSKVSRFRKARFIGRVIQQYLKGWVVERRGGQDERNTLP